MARKTELSHHLFQRALRLMPGGVNSPVRSFGAVGGEPAFISRASGPYVWDEDGNRYVDFLASWGPLILGHAHPDVVAAVGEAASRGTSYGAPCRAEVELADMVCSSVPSIEIVRMTNSGTEATMSAIRLARAWTGRDLIVKFKGCYHGHADYLLVSAGSGATTFGTPSSPGVPESFTRATLQAEFNDLDSVAALFREYGPQVACVIVEPVAGNMGVVPPADGFLEGLREITASAGALLIFDEVITGFRLAPGGAQQLWGVEPDITCLGKIIGGGLPVGAYGGRADIMEMVAPSGSVYQAGTLSGNPLAMAAGLATLRRLHRRGTYERLDELGAAMESGVTELARRKGLDVVVNRVGSMFTVFFTDRPVRDYVTALASDIDRFAAFFKHLLDAGIMFPPSQFESAFVSLAHGQGDVEAALEAVDGALDAARRVRAA